MPWATFATVQSLWRAWTVHLAQKLVWFAIPYAHWSPSVGLMKYVCIALTRRVAVLLVCCIALKEWGIYSTSLLLYKNVTPGWSGLTTITGARTHRRC